MSVLGVDISSNNGRNVDFRRLYKDGVRFVYIKVTEGTNYVNPYAAVHAKEAQDAGLLVGAYCFVSPKSGRTGRQEADYFVEKARAAGLLKKGCLRPCADIEISALPKGKPSRQYHYAFVERLIAKIPAGSFGAFDRRPLIYTGSWFWDGVLGAHNAHKCPLWLAAYSTAWKRFVPKAFKKGVSIHQFTDKLRVGGGSFDGDHYLGKSTATLRRHHTLKHSI